MCFSEIQSYVHFITLILGSIYAYPKYKLGLPLIFLSLKDLIQGLSYTNIRNKKSTRILTSLSWIHISLQPLFVNLFASHFDKNFKYWHIIFFACLIFGIDHITLLNEFDIQDDEDCIKKDKNDDYCSKNTKSYIGKYHIGYKFSTDKALKNSHKNIYLLLMFLPFLFTNCKIIYLLWGLFVALIYLIFANIGSGEQAAIWCYLSVFFCLPITIFSSTIEKYIM
jgi:hypothetical protein